MRSLLALIALGYWPQLALAQQLTAERARDLAGETARAVESDFDCRITLPGEARSDEFSNRWLVAYQASGGDCDAASEALQRRGEGLEITFFRRPNLDQLRGIVAEINRALRSGFGCHITTLGEPSYNGVSSQWVVVYRASGNNCGDAAEELRRRGAELNIFFMLRPEPGSVR